MIEHHQHCANTAENTIQTFKNHFVAGICTVDKKFPMQLWCNLLSQAEITFNLLQQVRCNTKISTYAVLEGEFNYNKTIISPPGTKALVFKHTTNRKSWAPHTKNGWYVGPALNHY